MAKYVFRWHNHLGFDDRELDTLKDWVHSNASFKAFWDNPDRPSHEEVFIGVWDHGGIAYLVYARWSPHGTFITVEHPNAEDMYPAGYTTVAWKELMREGEGKGWDWS